MRYYVEETKNAYESFWWLSDHLAPQWRKIRPPLESFSIVGDRLFTYEDVLLFKKTCDDLLLRHFMTDKSEANYTFWWLGMIGNGSKRSERIVHYYKYWKELEKDYDVHGFTSRIEEPITMNEELGYIGVAEFDLNALPLAVEMMRSSSETGCIVFKEKRENEASEEIMQLALAHEFEMGPLFSFSNLIPTLASHHYHTCLWKFYSTEEELCCFYRTTD